jgi:AMP phosphorylase
MLGEGDGKRIAMDLFKSRKAENKLREIIEAQGGQQDIKPEDIPLGEYTYTMKSIKNGVISWFDNQGVVEVARASGSPKDKGAGILLYKKVGDHVKKGEPIFTVYSEKSSKLNHALNVLKSERIMMIGQKMEMLIGEVKAPKFEGEKFILER